MDRQDFAVTQSQALQFFFERLREVSSDGDTSRNELLYNASVLAHFASTSTISTRTFPASPVTLDTVFDVFVLDRSQHNDPEIMEAAGSQCLLLTGFFYDQLKRRHNMDWYAGLGASFYDCAAHSTTDRARRSMMTGMSAHFETWRRRQHRLARQLRDVPRLLLPASVPKVG
jgi:hypothetical protein